MTLAATTNHVIDLARQVRAYYDRELPRHHRDYPLVHPDEQEPPPPAVELELRDYLASLPEGTIHTLLTLMDFARWGLRGDLASGHDALKRRFPRPNQAADEMLRHVPLGDHLADALEELEKQGIDVDGLFHETSLMS